MNNKRTSKVKNTILFAVIIVFVIAIIGGTYASYTSRGTINSSAEIAKWNISINGNDITSASQSFEVTATDDGTNNNVLTGKLAPGKSMVASLEVNPTGSEVAVDYLLNVADFIPQEFNTDSEIIVKKVTATVDGTSPDELTKTNDGYLYFERLEDVLNNKKVTFNVYLEWTEQGNAVGNAADTENIANFEDITADITITAKQHIMDDNAVAVVANINTLENMVDGINEGETLTIESELDFSNHVRIDPNTPGSVLNFPDNATIDLTGNTVTTHNMGVSYQGDNLTIKNGNFVALDNALTSTNPGSYALFLWDNDNTSHNVTVKNVTTTGGINTFNAQNVVLENCDVTATKFYAVFCNGNSTLTINSGTYRANTMALLGYNIVDENEVVNAPGGMIINGGTFITNGNALCLKGSDYSEPIVRGGIFDKDIVATGDVTLEEGYSINQISENRWQVTKD